MKKPLMMMAMALLAGCGPSQPKDTVENLVAHPDRLHEVEQQCANDYEKIGAAECNVASEARHRLFMGNGKPAYTSSKEPPRF